MLAATLLLLAQAAPAARTPAAPIPAAPTPATPSLATAVSPQTADARCMAAFSVLGTDAKTPEILRAAQMGALFFYGKVLGRNPAINLPATMIDAMRTARATQKAELARCGAELQRSGEAMQVVGQATGEAGPALAPAPAPRIAPTPHRP